MRVRDITAALEAFAPLSLQEKWDNSGLCIGSPDQEVHGVLLGFDCTPELIDEAVCVGADLVVTHHPLIFGGLKRIAPEMARRLGLERVSVLEPDGTLLLDGAEETVGLGMVGDWREPLSCEEAVARVKEAFGLVQVRCSRFIPGKISRVALCGGSGSSLIDAARAAGAQLYLCGDISYHHFFTPPGFVLMDIGHFEGEVEIVDILFSLLRKKFPTFAVRVSNTLKDSNPIQYL